MIYQNILGKCIKITGKGNIDGNGKAVEVQQSTFPQFQLTDTPVLYHVS